MKISGQNIISMYDYLFQYCCIPQELAYCCYKMTHNQIQKYIPNYRIFRFPMKYYQKEMELTGLLLWVRDSSKRIIPYVNPHFMKNINKGNFIKKLQYEIDIMKIWEEKLNSLNKVHQKQLIKERNDNYDEYKRK